MSESYREAERAVVEAVRAPQRVSRAYVLPQGRLPVTELAFDRAGAASPFGDDVRMPLPLDMITYVHPTEDAAPVHL
jgi:succinate dehydrogenase / fumarate reductase, iron-sulfur subunit